MPEPLASCSRCTILIEMKAMIYYVQSRIQTIIRF